MSSTTAVDADDDIFEVTGGAGSFNSAVSATAGGAVLNLGVLLFGEIPRAKSRGVADFEAISTDLFVFATVSSMISRFGEGVGIWGVSARFDGMCDTFTGIPLGDAVE